MTDADQKLIDSSLAHIQTLHKNLSSMWEGDTLSTFYYSVIAGTMARNGAEVTQALMNMLTEVYENTTKSHASLGKLTNGFQNGTTPPSS